MIRISSTTTRPYSPKQLTMSGLGKSLRFLINHVQKNDFIPLHNVPDSIRSR